MKKSLIKHWLFLLAFIPAVVLADIASAANDKGASDVAATAQDRLRKIAIVYDYGAVGDGVTDDTAAFNAALLASKRVRVPAATYKIAGTVSAQQDGNVLIGDGDATVIHCTTVATCIDLSTKTYGTIESLKLTSTTAAIGINVGTVGHYFRIHRVHIDGQNAGVPAGFKTAAIKVSRSYYGEISHSDITYSTVGILGTNEFNGNFVRSNSIRQCKTGILIDDTTSNSDGSSIIGNEIESAAKESLYGISLQGADSMVVSGNRIEYGVGKAHIFINSGVSAANYNQLYGNVLEGTIAAITLGTGGGLGVNHTMISGGRGVGAVTFNSDAADTRFDAPGGAYLFPVKLTDNGVRTTLSLFGNLSFAAGITGGTTSPTATFKYSINGDMVTLLMQQLVVTSNSNSFTLTGLPAICWPRGNTQTLSVRLIDNGVFSFGIMQVKTDGSITLGMGANNNITGFTASGTKGVSDLVVTWKRY